MPRMHAKGFSLVELMVVVVIVAILVGIGLPSFRDTFQRNRVATTGNEVIGSIALARAEAIRTTRGGGVCASSDGATCGNDWNAGWLVWANQGNVNATLDTGDEIIRVIQAHPRMEVSAQTAAGTTVGTIAFDPRGRAVAASRVILKPVSCQSGKKLQRTMEVNAVGQVKTIEGTC